MGPFFKNYPNCIKFSENVLLLILITNMKKNGFSKNSKMLCWPAKKLNLKYFFSQKFPNLILVRISYQIWKSLNFCDRTLYGEILSFWIPAYSIQNFIFFKFHNYEKKFEYLFQLQKITFSKFIPNYAYNRAHSKSKNSKFFGVKYSAENFECEYLA